MVQSDRRETTAVLEDIPFMSDWSMCVFFIFKPLFLAAIQHIQCRCWFFIPERYRLCGHKTTTQRCVARIMYKCQRAKYI